MRKPPESPNESRTTSVTTGSTKEPMLDPATAIPEAVALYFTKYWLITTKNSVCAKAKPNPAIQINK